VPPSKDALADMELPLYPAMDLQHIHLVRSEAEAQQALAQLMQCDALGFDTESKPTFVKGETSTGPHLAQLATDKHIFLFPLLNRDCLPVLTTVLESATVLKVGMGLGNDRSALMARFGIRLTNVIDMGEKLRGPSHRGTVGAKVAVAHFFGQRLVKSKKIGTSNWASSRLSDPQLRYAANDAHVALRIYREWMRQQHEADHHEPGSPT
jgi:ribonuclease D